MQVRGEEKGNREQRGEGERKRAHHYYHTFKLFQDTNLMEPTITFFSLPLLNDSAKLCNFSTTDKTGNRIMHPF